MRKMLRSILKVPDDTGVFPGDKVILSENFQQVYQASDIEWTGAELDVWNAIRGFWIQFNDLPTPDDVKAVLESELKADSKTVVDEVAGHNFMETASLRQYIREFQQGKKLREFLTTARTSMLIAAQGQKIDKHTELKGTKEAIRYLKYSSYGDLKETKATEK